MVDFRPTKFRIVQFFPVDPRRTNIPTIGGERWMIGLEWSEAAKKQVICQPEFLFSFGDLTAELVIDL